jgi:hypothetical protein
MTPEDDLISMLRGFQLGDLVTVDPACLAPDWKGMRSYCDSGVWWSSGVDSIREFAAKQSVLLTESSREPRWLVCLSLDCSLVWLFSDEILHFYPDSDLP